MDFHGMKRKHLQTLCKKHGIPGNLKSAEMACRLASLFEKETAFEKEITPEPIKDDLVDSREAKKVKFSHENEVFEFTRSVKKCQRRNIRSCKEGPAQGGIALRWSKRSVPNNNKEEEPVKDSEKEVSVDFKVEETRKCNRKNVLDIPKVEKVPRRSRRIVNNNEVELNTHEDFKSEKELVKNSVNEVSEDFEVEETRKCNKRNVPDVPKVEKVLRRSRRFVNNSEVELDTHEDFKIEKDQSIKLTTDVAKTCIRGGTADSLLCPTKDGKEDRKVKNSKGSGAANSTECEPIKDNTKKPSIDCKVQKNEKDRKTKMQDVEKVPRRSKRLGNNVNVDTAMRPVVDENGNAVKRVDQERSDSSQGGVLGIRSSELLEDGETQNGKSDSSGNDPVGATVDNTQDQAMANLAKICSARGDARDGASVDSIDKTEVNEEMIVPVRFTRNSSRQNSKKAPVVVEGNMVEKKKSETLNYLVKSPKRATRRMKRGRTEEPTLNKDSLSIQRNLTPEKFLVVNGKLEPGYAEIRNVTELGDTNVEARSSSKKTKTVNQELVKENQQGIVEGSSSSSESKAIEHDMIAENVLDSSPRKSVDSSKKINTQELSYDLMEEEREGKHEQDTLFMVALKKDKKEASSLSAVLIERLSVNKKNDELQSEVKTFSNSGSSDGYLVVETTPLPTSVPLTVSDPEVELSVPTDHIFEDNASLAIAEEDIRPDEETLISTLRSELKEHGSVSKLAVAEALENAAEYGKKFYSNKYHEEGSLEKDIQAANLHGNFFEYDTVNISAEEEAEISKVGSDTMTVPITRTLEEQELVKDKLQGMIEEPSSSETKAIEPLMIAENELDSTPKISADISQRMNTQEMSYELMEEELESNHEQDTISMTATNKDKEEASSLSKVHIERSSGNNNTGLQSKAITCPDNHSTDDYLFVEPTPPFASVQLTVSNPQAELRKPTGHILDDNALIVIVEEDIKTKEGSLISILRSELKENSSVSKLETEAKLESPAECGKEILLSKDNEKGSLEKDIQAADLHENFAEYKAENINAEKGAEITKVDCDTNDGNISSQAMLMLITSSLEEQMVSEQKEAYEMISPNKFNDDAETGSMSKGKSLLVKSNLPNMDKDPVSVESVSHVDTVQTSKNEGTTGLISPICEGTEYAMEKTPVLISMHHSCTETNLYEREEIDLHARVDDSITYEKFNVIYGDKSKDTAKNVVLRSTSITISDEESQSSRGEENLNLRHFDDLTEEKKQASSCEGRHCEKLEPPVEPKDNSLVISERAIPGERSCKLHGLELRQCSEEDELKALSQPLPTNRAASALDESPIFTIPERNSQLMEQHSINGKTRAAHSVTPHSYEAVKSPAIVFTTPEQYLFMGYTGLAEARNKKGHMATYIPDESDIPNTTKRPLMLESSMQNEAINEESIFVELHDESIIDTSPVRQSSDQDFEGDVGGESEENKNVELHCESGILLRNSASHGAENSGGNEAMEPELREAACLPDKSSKKSNLLTSLERQLIYGDSLQKEAEKTREEAHAEFHHESVIPNISERHTFPEESDAAKTDEATKSEENKVVELHVDCNIITSDEKHSAFETSEADEGVKEDNITAKFHDESDIFTTTKSHSLMGDPELDEAEKYRENKDIELLGESNTFNYLEGHHTNEKSGLEGRGFLENSEQHNSGKVEFKDESAYFTRLESCLLLGESGQDRFDIGKSDINEYQSHYASSPIVTLKDDRVAPESCVAVRDNTTNDLYDRTTLEVSYSHEFNVGQETTAKPKDYQENDVEGLQATPGTLKKSRAHSPYVETVNRLDFDIEGTETTMEAGMNDSCNFNEDLRNKDCEPLTMEPDTSKTETVGLSVGEFSSHLEVSGACSLVSEELAQSTEIQNQGNNAPGESPIAETKGRGELIEAKVTNNTQDGMLSADIVQSGKNNNHEGDLQLPESGYMLPEDEATSTIAAAFDLQSETRVQPTFQSNKNEKGEDMVPEETLNESSYGTRTPSQKQAIRPRTLIQRTQVKPKRHDMKENAQSSKIMQNLNVTAPRTSKRQPLQDLRKIN